MFKPKSMTQLTTKKDKTDNTTLQKREGLPGKLTKPSAYKKIRQKMKKQKNNKLVGEFCLGEGHD